VKGGNSASVPPADDPKRPPAGTLAVAGYQR
jgi:hypothetical protein